MRTWVSRGSADHGRSAIGIPSVDVSTTAMSGSTCERSTARRRETDMPRSPPTIHTPRRRLPSIRIWDEPLRRTLHKKKSSDPGGCRARATSRFECGQRALTSPKRVAIPTRHPPHTFPMCKDDAIARRYEGLASPRCPPARTASWHGGYDASFTHLLGIAAVPGEALAPCASAVGWPAGRDPLALRIRRVRNPRLAGAWVI